MQTTPSSIVWLRRDLRLHDHPSLSTALQSAEPVQPVFIFDSDILARFSDRKDRRLTFLVESCLDLHRMLEKRGGGLLVLHGRPVDIIPSLANIFAAPRVVASEDYEPATQQRDAAVSKLLSDKKLLLVKDHVVMAPGEISKDDKSPYKVFTPYSRRWREQLTDAHTYVWPVEDYGRYAKYEEMIAAAQHFGLRVLNMQAGTRDILAQIGYEPADISLWPVDAGKQRLEQFVQRHISRYKETRDLVSIEGTSRLSPYLRFGRISIRECTRLALGVNGSDAWVNELIWRDFYQMILWHFPETTTQEFQAVYRGTLDWSSDAEALERFKQGMTGFPIIDAAMRQLLKTGWMHNRARMIVASFMTKDLLLDWRLGEEHFAQYLMDYELASNLGGWQWAASTGTDAQPYFRIFNPVLQSKKFDPEGEYIRTYVPELAMLPVKDIHEPWKKARPASYPLPIVEHDVMRDKALAMFKQAAQKMSA